MQRSVNLLVLAAWFSVLLAACAPAAQPTGVVNPGEAPSLVPSSAPTPGDTMVNGSSNSAMKKGQVLDLKVGDTFDVRIPTIPTAGFTWKPQNLNTQILMQVGDPVYEPGTGPNAAGGIFVVTFKVVGTGSTPLTLIYVAAASSGGPSLYSQSFGITVNAK